MATKKQTPAETRALVVTARRDGFRRAGITWANKPTTFSLAELTDEQVEAIRSEPMLVVEEIELA